MTGNLVLHDFTEAPVQDFMVKADKVGTYNDVVRAEAYARTHAAHTGAPQYIYKLIKVIMPPPETACRTFTFSE